MTPSRPYLIRAINEWILDNALTPYLLVDVASDDVVVPSQYVENGRIVLNISPTAVRALELANDGVRFNARFAGQPMDVSVPITAVLAIYARENGRGMMFTEEEGGPEPPDSGPSPDDGHGKPSRPHLKVVK